MLHDEAVVSRDLEGKFFNSFPTQSIPIYPCDRWKNFYQLPASLWIDLFERVASLEDNFSQNVAGEYIIGKHVIRKLRLEKIDQLHQPSHETTTLVNLKMKSSIEFLKDKISRFNTLSKSFRKSIYQRKDFSPIIESKKRI